MSAAIPPFPLQASMQRTKTALPFTSYTFTARYGLNFYTQFRLKLVFAQFPACLYQKDEQAMSVNLQHSKLVAAPLC